MKLSMVVSGYPPDFDGIGDYTSLLAQVLSRKSGVDAPVCVYTRKGENQEFAGINVIPFFDATNAASFSRLKPLIHSIQHSGWLLVQYNPFGWGRRGFCPAVPKTLRAIRKLPQAPRIGVMFHELFTEDAGWKNKLMKAWQRIFTLQVAKAADLRLASCQAYADWLDERGLPASSLPVGSNLPDVPRKLHGGAETLYFGTFGSSHFSRRIDLVAAAVAAVRAQGIDARFVFVGSGGDKAKGAFQKAGIPFRATGGISPRDAAEEIAKLDVFLAPFSDGLSGRRTSAIAALQAGVSLVSTAGHRTDSFLRQKNDESFFLAGSDEDFMEKTSLLAKDQHLRQCVGMAGRTFYQKMLDWPVIGEQLVGILSVYDENRAN
jgi:glycosyltransferase involved in cell wall biosynthesis